MQRSTKIILGTLGGMVLLAILAIGAAAWYVARNAEGWMEKGKAREEAGQAAGAALDSRGCVDRAVADYRKDRGPISAVSHRIWLKGCLQTAQRDESICPAIRAEDTLGQIREVLAAQKAFCIDRGLGADQNCQQLAEQVFDFCYPTQ